MPVSLAVIGAGRAGRARIRALEGRADARLAAVVSSHEPAGRSFADVLADPSVSGVILCTPNLLHESQARAALEADKHVLVEFPLAAGPEPARGLFALARARSRVLHEEHIELLSPAQIWLRARAAELGPPRSGRVEFSGAYSGWFADPALAGTPALCALARLHRLLDLFGDAAVRAASLERAAGYRLSVELEFASGGSLELVETRAPDAPRATRWHVECERGPLADPPAERPEGLFARDLACFLARVAGQGEHYVSEARVLHALELVAAIERRL